MFIGEDARINMLRCKYQSVRSGSMLTAGDVRDCFRDRLIDGDWVVPHEMRGLIPIILNGILRKLVLPVSSDSLIVTIELLEENSHQRLKLRRRIKHLTQSTGNQTCNGKSISRPYNLPATLQLTNLDEDHGHCLEEANNHQKGMHCS